MLLAMGARIARHSTGHVAVELLRRAHHGGEGEHVFHDLPSREAHGTRPLGVSEELTRDGGERAGVAPGHEIAGDAVANDLARGTHIA